jgi:putative phosphoribosyl transferase
MRIEKNKEEIRIPIGPNEIAAFLHVPENARGLVLFAHGSGSGRHSPRNQLVAKFLNDHEIATLLMDLLTSEEEEADIETRALRFDIPFLAQRLLEATKWASQHSPISNLPFGYFGASTGAAAALVASAETEQKIKAVVSRGGRPDLAGQVLPRIQCPTLLIVGEKDFGVLELNREAYALLSCEKKLEIIPNATHLFEELGTLEDAAQRACHWFERYF